MWQVLLYWLKIVMKVLLVKLFHIVKRLRGYRRENIKQNDKRRKALIKSCHLTKEQIKEAQIFYKNYYGKKINLKWHKLYTAISRKFDYQYFPELLYTPEYQRQYNSPDYYKAIADKNLLPLLIKGSKCSQTPETLFYSSNGILLDSNHNKIDLQRCVEILKKEKRVFLKPSVDSNSGNGCFVYDVDQESLSVAQLEKILKPLGKDFVVQKIIKNQKDIEAINPSSLNTFRIITYTINGIIKASPVILRVGVNGNYLDNAHAGGVFVAIDNEGNVISNGKNEFGLDLEVHPDTNIRFKGYKIKNVRKMIDSVIKAAYLIPHVGVIDWDVTLNEKEEPVIVEANTYNGSIWLIQMSHGVSVFGEDTKDILLSIKENKIRY